MSSTAPAGAWTRRRRWLLQRTFLREAMACLEVGLHTHLPPLTGRVGFRLSAHRRPRASVPICAQVARSRSTDIVIPAIGLPVSLSDLGLKPVGTVQVPTNALQPAGSM